MSAVYSTWASPARRPGRGIPASVTYHKEAIARHVVEMTCAREHAASHTTFPSLATFLSRPCSERVPWAFIYPMHVSADDP